MIKLKETAYSSTHNRIFAALFGEFSGKFLTLLGNTDPTRKMLILFERAPRARAKTLAIINLRVQGKLCKSTRAKRLSHSRDIFLNTKWAETVLIGFEIQLHKYK